MKIVVDTDTGRAVMGRDALLQVLIDFLLEEKQKSRPAHSLPQQQQKSQITKSQITKPITTRRPHLGRGGKMSATEQSHIALKILGCLDNNEAVDKCGASGSIRQRVVTALAKATMIMKDPRFKNRWILTDAGKDALNVGRSSIITFEGLMEPHLSENHISSDELKLLVGLSQGTAPNRFVTKTFNSYQIYNLLRSLARRGFVTRKGKRFRITERGATLLQQQQGNQITPIQITQGQSPSDGETSLTILGDVT